MVASSTSAKAEMLKLREEISRLKSITNFQNENSCQDLSSNNLDFIYLFSSLSACRKARTQIKKLKVPKKSKSVWRSVKIDLEKLGDGVMIIYKKHLSEERIASANKKNPYEEIRDIMHSLKRRLDSLNENQKSLNNDLAKLKAELKTPKPRLEDRIESVDKEILRQLNRFYGTFGLKYAEILEIPAFQQEQLQLITQNTLKFFEIDEKDGNEIKQFEIDSKEFDCSIPETTEIEDQIDFVEGSNPEVRISNHGNPTTKQLNISPKSACMENPIPFI